MRRTPDDLLQAALADKWLRDQREAERCRSEQRLYLELALPPPTHLAHTSSEPEKSHVIQIPLVDSTSEDED